MTSLPPVTEPPEDETVPCLLPAVLDGTELLKGMTVIMTGATGGIGRHVTRLLVTCGAKVAIVDLSTPGVSALTAELADGGAEVIGDSFDAANVDEFREFHRRVRSELGPVGGLVNCAGRWEPKRFQDITAENLSLMLHANVGTAFAACQSVLPEMIARRGGSVVNFASTAGEYGSISPAAHYAAAKGAVIGMTKSLAREASPYNVRVNAISPGPTDTVALGAATPEQKASVGARTLFDRLGDPDEIAASCIFLLSPLSSFVTGHILRVNGGSLL
jgi:NAD(P)-dependent dehydrogenase (short-subunit alcohol dehydrogenase family)